MNLDLDGERLQFNIDEDDIVNDNKGRFLVDTRSSSNHE